MPPTFDLQSHSTHSDGELAPRDVVAAAAAAGITLLALTDHDTVSGVDEALHAAAEHGVTLVPAIEMSVCDDAAPDIHILGYGIDHRDGQMLDSLDEFRADRAGRAHRMVDNLRRAGLELDRTTIEQRQVDGLPICRPHLAEAVLTHEGNLARLAAEQIATVGDVIRGYLIEGKPGFAPRSTPTATEAIDVIHSAGGVAVWAHPFWDIAVPDAVVATLDRFCGLGLDGVEVFYVAHDEDQTHLLYEAASERGLLCTGSSDFHGPGHPLFARMRAFELHQLAPVLGSVAIQPSSR